MLFLVFTLNLGFRLDVLFGVPFKRFLSLAPPPGGAGLVLASDFQRTSASLSLLPVPLFFGRSGLQRYGNFYYWQSKISIIFDNI